MSTIKVGQRVFSPILGLGMVEAVSENIFSVEWVESKAIGPYRCYVDTRRNINRVEHSKYPDVYVGADADRMLLAVAPLLAACDPGITPDKDVPVWVRNHSHEEWCPRFSTGRRTTSGLLLCYEDGHNSATIAHRWPEDEEREHTCPWAHWTTVKP